ncbi:MAG: hypothetical protein Q8K99_05655 [Actinomycetota bacterium]|nr:hypothetical protein [Actinomycetota bacterium]
MTLVLLLAVAASAAACKAQDSQVKPSGEPESKPASSPLEENADAVVTLEGWGTVRIGASETDVQAVLGDADSQEEFPAMDGEPAVVFYSFLDEGVQVSFVKPEMTANALFFHSGEGDHSDYSQFDAGTDKGIAWDSTSEDVVKVYGNPVNDYRSDDGGLKWRRLVYPEISFRFQDERLETIALGTD